MTAKDSRKIQNIRRKSEVYFSVDTDNRSYKGVKGKASTSIVKDEGKTMRIAEKIVAKYLGSVENPYGTRLLDSVRTGSEIVVEITPDYYSVWDYGKRT